jgi:hypothetical protein
MVQPGSAHKSRLGQRCRCRHTLNDPLASLFDQVIRLTEAAARRPPLTPAGSRLAVIFTADVILCSQEGLEKRPRRRTSRL